MALSMSGKMSGTKSLSVAHTLNIVRMSCRSWNINHHIEVKRPIDPFFYPYSSLVKFTSILWLWSYLSHWSFDWCQVFCRWFVQSHGWQIGKKKIEGKRDNGQKHSENWFAAQTTKWYKSKCRFTHFGTKNPKVKWPLDTKSPTFIWMPKVKRLAHLWVPNVVHRKS